MSTFAISTSGRERLIRIALRSGFGLTLLLAWQLAGDDSTLLSMPTVTRTLSMVWQMTRDGQLIPAFLNSNIAMVTGYLLALLFAVPVGVAMGSWSPAGQIARPFLTILLAVPMIAMMPLIQVIFGPGLASRVVVVFVFSFVFIAVNTEVGTRSVPSDLREMAKSYMASPLQRMRYVILPHAFPAIMSGARLGLGRAVTGMVLAELFLVGSGMGSLLTFYKQRFNTGGVFAIILVLVIEGIVVMALARVVENRVNRQWGRM